MRKMATRGGNGPWRGCYTVAFVHPAVWRGPFNWSFLKPIFVLKVASFEMKFRARPARLAQLAPAFRSAPARFAKRWMRIVVLLATRKRFTHLATYSPNGDSPYGQCTFIRYHCRFRNHRECSDSDHDPRMFETSKPVSAK
jgi:hypothetical protein